MSNHVVLRVEEHAEPDEEMPLIETVECRICQEEDQIKNLESPCGCSGSVKYAHRKCIQRWCEEKRDTTCEICHQIYQPGYVVTTPPPIPRRPDEVTIDISRGWMIAGTPVDLHDPRFLEERRLDSQYDAFIAAEQRLMNTEFDDVGAADRHMLDTDYDIYTGSNAGGYAFCRFATFTLLALFLMRHALDTSGDTDEDEDGVFFSIFLMRTMGFLLPCYIMAWAISLLQHRREREEERFAASEVAIVLQSVQDHGLQFTIVPGRTVTPQPESPLPHTEP